MPSDGNPNDETADAHTRAADQVVEARNPAEPGSLRLLAEELNVDRERVETGRVRVQVLTREHEEMVDIPLERERYEVERVAVNRPVDARPPTRQDGDTTIIPVVEEVLIIQRGLVLKEEVHIKLVRTIEQHLERVVLRRQEAVITRVPAETPATDPKQG